MSESTVAPWVNLEGLAGVEASSEHPEYPITGPLASPPEREWRAADGGEQWVRLVFATPQAIHRIRLVFREPQRARAQELALRWWAESPSSVREAVRQQFNFDPAGAT